MAPTKKALGVGYLFGGGLALIGSLIGYVWFTRESVVVVAIGAFAAVLPFTAILYIGYMFSQDDLPEAFVWEIAQWFALGLGISTLFTGIVVFVSDFFAMPDLLPSLVVITIAATSVIGALLGLIVAFREHHRRLRGLYQRNTVMNRVLRHNIRNDMNVILARAELLAEEPDDVASHANVIKQKTNEVISLSEAAREIESIQTTADPERIDVGEAVAAYVDRAQETYPDATISSEVLCSRSAPVGELFPSVLETIVENAVEYHDDDPEVTITVAEPPGKDDSIDVRIKDDGPGIPPDQREVLFQDGEESIQHGEGLGLWLVKWFVDRCDGDLWFEAGNPHGTTVCLRLPAGSDEA